MGGVEFVRFDDVAGPAREVLRCAGNRCGICIEAVQGEGGVCPVSKEFFAAARELCDSTGALLLADEIQSGMGRTGEWFAYQHYGILPDITTVAKPMANGLPMGAMLLHGRGRAPSRRGMHGSTFGGWLLLCAVARRSTPSRPTCWRMCAMWAEHFKSQRLTIAARLHLSLVRGMGPMLGIEMVGGAAT